MRVSVLVITTALVAGLSGLATAQTQTQNQTQTAPPTNQAPTLTGEHSDSWLAAGFVGSSFGGDTDASSWEFGGQIGYLWGGRFGAEFLTDFAPTFSISPVEVGGGLANAILDDEPAVNTYMFNAIGALPIGAGRFEPYVSGGLGVVTMHTNVFDNTLPILTGAIDTISGSSSTLGGNIGLGVYSFSGSVGFRADIRYYKVPGNDTLSETTVANLFTEDLLSGINFWRGNVGVAFRW